MKTISITYGCFLGPETLLLIEARLQSNAVFPKSFPACIRGVYLLLCKKGKERAPSPFVTVVLTK
jgi:hypothetical protein